MPLKTFVHFLIYFFCLINFLSAQSPTLEWQKCLGGSDEEDGYYAIPTSDGGCIACGISTSNDGDVSGNHLYYDSVSGNWFTNLDTWVVKTDALGNIEWQRSLGGSFGEWTGEIIQTSDGGYAIIGTTGSADGDVTFNHGGGDVWLVKLDSNGNVSWQKTYGGPGDEGGSSIVQTVDSGFVFVGFAIEDGGDVAGHHGSLGADFWIVKTDSNGAIEWQKCLGGSGDEGAVSIIMTFTGDFLITGMTSSSDGDVTFNHGGGEYWVVKIDGSGNILWQKTYGGTSIDSPKQIVQSTDSNFFYVIGDTQSNNGDVSNLHGAHPDFWCIKIDTAGSLIWQKTLGSSGTDYGFSVDKTSDGGCVVMGGISAADGDVTVNYGNGSLDYWVAKLSSQGQLQWQKSLGGSSNDLGRCVKQTPDGGFILNGYSVSNNIDVTNNHSIYGDYWLVKLSGLNGIEQNHYLYNTIITPNPSNGIFNFANFSSAPKNILINDVSGRLVFKTTNQSTSFAIDISSQPPGIYFVKVIQNNNVTVQKIIIQ